MRSRTTAVTLAGIALLLLGVYIVLASRVDLAARDGSSAVWDLPVADFVRITIRQPGENGDYLTFEKNVQGNWILASPEIPYDQALADGLTLSLSYITAEKEIASTPVSLSEYGLDAPIDVRVFMEDGTEHKLLIGGESSSGTARYFSLDDGKVYTMNAAKAQAIALDSMNVRDNNVLHLTRALRPREIAAKITRISLVEGQTLILEAERDKNGNWVHNGSSLLPEQDETATALANALARLIAEKFIGKPDEAYQLDPPRFTIEFENENGSQTLQLGALTQNGASQYALIEGEDMVFTVTRKGFTFLE